MIRNILRTSRWLARRQINKYSPILLGQVPRICNTSNLFSSVSNFSTSDQSQTADNNITSAVFEEICNETLESLCDYFEEIVENEPKLKGADIVFSDGVLTVALGSSIGTYVINRQTPNRQIWLSSPVSGPKRYDLILKNGGHWIYKHDGVTLHALLQSEISKIVENKIDFNTCAHSLV